MNISSFTIEAHVVRKRKEKYEFLLLKRAETEIYPGLWQMVTGKIKKGEKAFETALRELKEETGLKPIEFWVAPKTNSFYYPEKDTIYMVPVFVILVDNRSEVKLSNEHTEYKWMSKSKAQKMLPWEEQRKSVEIIHNYMTKDRNTLEFVRLAL